MKYTEEQEKRIYKADLITLPKGEMVRNCTNCVYVMDNNCEHPKMKLPLVDGAERMCCNYWDKKGVKHWGKG